MPSNWSPLPNPDEIEITLLGRGFGESVVLHLLDNEWMVIDSHFDGSKSSAPLTYLVQAGVAPEAVKVILATHFHDDHIGGISQLYQWASTAELAISLPKTANEFHTYLFANDFRGFGQISSGVNELANLIRIRQDQSRPPPIQCQANLTLIRKHSAATDKEVAVTALSPSPADVEEFLLHLGAAIEQQEGTAARLEAFDPNDISVAAWLSVGDEAALLGADLEVQAKEDRGWKAILASKGKPLGRASVFKVAHHGSGNGDHPEIWNNLLTPAPVAIVTPFNKGIGVPKSADKARILGHTDKAYITTPVPFRKYRDGTPMVRSALDAAGIVIHEGNGEVGRISLRKTLAEADWRVHLANNAAHLERFVPRD